jgi:hypothetical protein
MSARPHVEDGVGRIPLFSRQGELRAWATVDADALPGLVEFGWFLHQGRVVRNVGRDSVKMPLDRHLLGLGTGPEWGLRHLNGDRLDCRRTNLVLNGVWLARALQEDPETILFATQRAAARMAGSVPADAGGPGASAAA